VIIAVFFQDTGATRWRPFSSLMASYHLAIAILYGAGLPLNSHIRRESMAKQHGLASRGAIG